MKIIVTGKGGSGKSTISTLLSKAFQQIGSNVLLIDADESNLGLHRLMGADSPVVLMDSLGGKKGFKEKTQSVFPGMPGGLFSDRMTLDEIPDECLADVDGIKLFSTGKIHSAGEGCACPMGRLSKMILSKLVIAENDVVIIDTAAGIEHFGRGLDTSCDLVLGVVDPTYESFLLAEKISAMAAEAELSYAMVLNKVDEQTADVMERHVDMKKVLGRLGNEPSIFLAGLEGKPLEMDKNGLQAVASEIQKMMGGN